MDKGQRKKEEREKRQRDQHKKRRNMRILIWTIAVCFIALIAILIVFKPKPAALALSNDQVPTLGKAGAPVKITEFGDFKCPACAFFSQNIMSKIKTEFVDTGKASFSYQNYMIISPDSLTAALAGQAIYHQSNDEFWKFYDAIFKNQLPETTPWATPDYLTSFAQQQGLKLDFAKLKQDIVNGTYADEVNKQKQFAINNRFSSTPTVLINGQQLDEKTTLNYDNFKAAVQKALSEATK